MDSLDKRILHSLDLIENFLRFLVLVFALIIRSSLSVLFSGVISRFSTWYGRVKGSAVECSATSLRCSSHIATLALTTTFMLSIMSRCENVTS